MFAGSLKQMDLSQVLKLLTASHQTGVLNLMDSQAGTTVATLYLQVGQLVHAQCGGTSGLDAISESCRLSEEAFAFEENVMAPQQSLSPYPTAKLLDKMTEQISEAKALRLAMPSADEVPVYLPGASLAGLDATADDLSLLILCNGARNVNDLARDGRRPLFETARAVAKFRKAGIVEIKKTKSPEVPSPASPLPEPALESVPSENSSHDDSHSATPGMMTPEAGGMTHVDSPGAVKQPKYWRGKLIEE